MVDLFDARAEPTQPHPNFVSLRDSQHHADARVLMNDLFSRMGDPSGTFAPAFRTDGFHARVFELATFAYLEEAGYTFDRAHASPDFLAILRGQSIAFEATTANPPDGAHRDISLLRLKHLSEGALRDKVRVEFPKRIASSLRKKAALRYHKLPHCREIPLVIVVGPFFEPGSVYYTDEALIELLYGPLREASPSICTPLFAQKSFEHVSAILFCNQFTVPKFFRLASQFPRVGMTAVRSGLCYSQRTDHQFAVQEYAYLVGDPQAPMETWRQGVTLFGNPLAKVPLAPELCPHTSCLWLDSEGNLERTVAPFHPVTSFMHVKLDGQAEPTTSAPTKPVPLEGR